jgi:hypothetical protein
METFARKEEKEKMADEQNRSPEHRRENDAPDLSGGNISVQRTFIHRVLRYVPSPLRNEGVNIGVLLYDPNTGERRLRLIEEESEFSRVRRLRPAADEAFLRGLYDHLESRLNAAAAPNAIGGPIRGTLRNGHGNPPPHSTEWLPILEKWDNTLSNSLQLAEPRATVADDINSEMDRLYSECVTGGGFGSARPSQPSAREQMRHYMDQVFRQAGVFNRIDRNVRVGDYALDDDPMTIDYGYWRNDKKRGFVQTVSLSTRPEDAKVFTYTAIKIREKASDAKVGIAPEFLAVTDIAFRADNENHTFLKGFLARHDVEHIALENAAVWVAKLRPMLQ